MSAREVCDTRTAVDAYALSLSVDLLAMALAAVLPGWLAGASGLVYGFLGPAHWFFGSRRHHDRPAPEGGMV